MSKSPANLEPGQIPVVWKSEKEIKKEMNTTKTEAKHTALPYKYWNGEIVGNPPAQETVCKINNRINAAFIVRACNNFEQMLATLKDAETHIISGKPDLEILLKLTKAIEQAEQEGK